MKIILIFITVFQLMMISITSNVHAASVVHDGFDGGHLHIKAGTQIGTSFHAHGHSHSCTPFLGYDDHKSFYHYILELVEFDSQLNTDVSVLDVMPDADNDHHNESNHLHFSLVMALQQHNLLPSIALADLIYKAQLNFSSQIYPPPVPPPNSPYSLI